MSRTPVVPKPPSGVGGVGRQRRGPQTRTMAAGETRGLPVQGPPTPPITPPAPEQPEEGLGGRWDLGPGVGV